MKSGLRSNISPVFGLRGASTPAADSSHCRTRFTPSDTAPSNREKSASLVSHIPIIVAVNPPLGRQVQPVQHQQALPHRYRYPYRPYNMRLVLSNPFYTPSDGWRQRTHSRTAIVWGDGERFIEVGPPLVQVGVPSPVACLSAYGRRPCSPSAQPLSRISCVLYNRQKWSTTRNVRKIPNPEAK